MTDGQPSYVVMFIDFVGSTRLYDLLDDREANRIIDQVMGDAAACVESSGGRVIKTIGDEIMCCFENADDAVTCACNIHSQTDELPPRNGFTFALRVGLHFGSALLMEDGDLYGDAVNVAARMAGLARARQIILSRETLERLAPPLRSMGRVLDHVSVKGKRHKMTICQIIWEPHDATFMQSNIDLFNERPDDSRLILRFGDQEFQLNKESPCLMFGRSEQCDLVIDADHVSRCHARVEYRRGKYVLVDQSTNGTFVTLDDGHEVYLRREEMTLWGDGVISIGTLGDRDGRSKIYFYS